MIRRIALATTSPLALSTPFAPTLKPAPAVWMYGPADPLPEIPPGTIATTMHTGRFAWFRMSSAEGW